MHKFAKAIRSKTLEMIYEAKASHIASCFSMADILAVLYLKILHINPADPKHPKRDRLIISKGHAAASVYAALALRGFFSMEELKTFCMPGSRLLGHVNHDVPGIEYSSGSLGHGLSIGAGIALAEEKEKLGFRTFVIASDGELNEGSSWEAILFAGHHRLKNLTLIIDYNRMQALGYTSDILDLDPLGKKLEAFGWDVLEVDGHDYTLLEKAFQPSCLSIKPKAIIAFTTKGRGIACMENSLAWHYKNPTNLEEMLLALEEKV